MRYQRRLFSLQGLNLNVSEKNLLWKMVFGQITKSTIYLTTNEYHEHDAQQDCFIILIYNLHRIKYKLIIKCKSTLLFNLNRPMATWQGSVQLGYAVIFISQFNKTWTENTGLYITEIREFRNKMYKIGLKSLSFFYCIMNTSC